MDFSVALIHPLNIGTTVATVCIVNTPKIRPSFAPCAVTCPDTVPNVLTLTAVSFQCVVRAVGAGEFQPQGSCLGLEWPYLSHKTSRGKKKSLTFFLMVWSDIRMMACCWTCICLGHIFHNRLEYSFACFVYKWDLMDCVLTGDIHIYIYNLCCWLGV